MPGSIFDVLRPDEGPQGIRGALGAGIRGLSDFFQQATPALMADEEVGFGGAFAAGLFGGLAQPQRQAEARQAQERETALQLLPMVWRQLSPESQQQVIQTAAPGLEIQPGLSDVDRMMIEGAREVWMNPKFDKASRDRAAMVMTSFDPETQQKLLPLMQDMGVEMTTERMFTFLSQLLDDFTPESVGQFEATGYSDWSLLQPLPEKAKAGAGAGNIRDSQAMADFSMIEELKAQDPNLTDEGAAEQLGITGIRWSNVQRFVGVSPSQSGVVTYADLFRKNMRDVVENDLGMTFDKYVTESNPKTIEAVINKTSMRTRMEADAMEQAGIPVIRGGNPSPRSQAYYTHQQQVQREREMREILDEAERRIKMRGATTPEERQAIVEEVRKERSAQ